MPYWVYSLFHFFDVDFLTLSFVWFCLQLLQKLRFRTSRFAASSKLFCLNKSHTYERTTFLFVCCCWRKGKRLNGFFFCFGKRNVWKVSASKGEESSHSTLEPRWLLWGSIRFTTYVSCLMMINMTVWEREHTIGFCFLFFVYLYDFALYWFSFYRVIKALVSLIII